MTRTSTISAARRARSAVRPRPRRIAFRLALTLAVLAATLATGFASNSDLDKIQRYSIDPYRSYLSFAIGFMKIRTEDGTFHDYSGTILIDSEDFTRSSVTAAILAESVFTGVRPRDRHLRGEDFFDVEKYPVILFRSTSVAKTSDGLELQGDLTMHGQTHRIVIPVTMLKDVGPGEGSNKLHLQGHLTLRRHDYGIIGNFWGDKVLSNDVQIELNIEAEPLKVPQPQMADAMQLRSLGEVLLPTIESEGVAAATDKYQELRRQQSNLFDFSPPALLRLAEQLGEAGKMESALELVRFNLKLFPNDETSWDQLGWFRLLGGDVAGAMAAYQRLLTINDHNTNALEMLRWLKSRPLGEQAAGR